MMEEVLIRMGMDARPVAQALRGIKAKFRSFKDELGNMFKGGSGGGIGGMLKGGLLGMAAAGGAAWLNGAKEAVQYAKEIRHVSEELGVSASTLQAWSLKVAKSGGDAELAEKALEKLSIKLGAARSGTKDAVDLFRDLGLSLTDSTGHAKNTESVLNDVADKFKEIKDPTLQAHLAFELFGKSGIKVVNALKDGAKGLEDFKKAAAGKIISDADVDRLAQIGKLFTDGFGRVRAMAGKSAVMLSTFFMGDAGTDNLLKKVNQRREAGELSPEQFEQKQERIAKTVEAMAKLEEKRNAAKLAQMTGDAKLLELQRERHALLVKSKAEEDGSLENINLRIQLAEKDKEIAEEMHKLAEKSAEEKKKETQFIEEQNHRLEHQREVLQGISNAEDRRDDARQSLQDAKEDRGKFSLHDLATMGGPHSDAMWQQINNARQVEWNESQASAIDRFQGSGSDEAKAFRDKADEIRGGIDSLKDGERFPFKDLAKSAMESQKSLAELVRKAEGEGIKVDPSNG
jgi:hypothetical protein